MKPISFDEQNTVIGANQKGVNPLPCHSVDGIVISCWQLSESEIKSINETGKLYVGQWKGNQLLQPINIHTNFDDFFVDPTVEKIY